MSGRKSESSPKPGSSTKNEPTPPIGQGPLLDQPGFAASSYWPFRRPGAPDMFSGPAWLLGLYQHSWLLQPPGISADSLRQLYGHQPLYNPALTSPLAPRYPGATIDDPYHSGSPNHLAIPIVRGYEDATRCYGDRAHVGLASSTLPFCAPGESSNGVVHGLISGVSGLQNIRSSSPPDTRQEGICYFSSCYFCVV